MLRVVATLALPVLGLLACAGLPTELAPASVPGDPALRSAGLQRARGIVTSPGVEASREQAQLRAHFDRVLAILEAQEDASLDQTLARLGDEAHVDRATLAERRRLQLERLRRYRDAGRFPRNLEQPGLVLPIFVDARDTACAVGWLMRQDGWDEEVAAIASGDNNVYVDDVRGGPLLAWVETSGLTREEAALIQPAYSPPAFSVSFEDLLNGATLTASGLRYENFQLERTSSTVPANVCLLVPDYPDCNHPIDPGLVAPLDAIGITGGALFIDSGDGQDQIETTLSNWLFLGDDQPGDLSVSTLYLSVLDLSFDVVTTDPALGIGAAALESVGGWNLNLADLDPSTNTTLWITGSIEHQGAPLGSLVLGDEESEVEDALFNGSTVLVGYETLGFTPVRRIHVSTIARLYPDSGLAGFFYEFDLVPIPEPGSAALLALGLCALGLRRRYSGISPT